MVVSATRSTVTLVPPAGGFLPDGQATAIVRVVARDDADAVLPFRQVNVMPTQPGNFPVDHAHVWPSQSAIACSFTDAEGVCDVPVRALVEGSQSYLVRVGEDDGLIPVTLNGLAAKPTGPSIGPDFSLLTNPVITGSTSIDVEWLVANAGGQPIVRNQIFAGPVTLTIRDVAFSNCVFAVPTTVATAFTSGGYAHTMTRCAFRGAMTSTVVGSGGTYDRCVWSTTGGVGISIEQSGTNFTPSVFKSCVWSTIGTLTAGGAHCVLGTPMRNVLFDHCWFNVPTNTVAPVFQITNVDGSRGPFFFGCWIDTNSLYAIENRRGSSNLAPQQLRVFGCRFGPERVAGTYLFDQGTESQSQGNMDENGVVIVSTTNPEINREAGPRFLWPQTTLATQPTAEWEEASSGGGGGGGGGTGGGGGGPGTGGGGGGTVLPPNVDEDIYVTVEAMRDTPVGGGGSVRNITKVRTSVGEAVPVLVGGVDPPPPDDPLVVEWIGQNTVMAEGGAPVQVSAQLFLSSGGQPPSSRLTGFTVPLSRVLVSAGGGIAAGQDEDFVLPDPLQIVFPAGAGVASIVVQAVDDAAAEGAESMRLVLGDVVVTTPEGPLTVVRASSAASHDLIIEPSDNPGIATVFFGASSDSTPEPFLNSVYQFPVRMSQNPTANVAVRVTFGGGTAVTPGDYSILTPPLPGSPLVVEVVFAPTSNGAPPADKIIQLGILADTIDESDETVVATLTSMDPTVAQVGVIGQFTLTIVDNDDPAPTEPQLGWLETSLALREGTQISGQAPQPTVRTIEVRTWNNTTFATSTDVDIEIVSSGGAEFGLDYFLEGPAWTDPAGSAFGKLRFAAGASSAIMRIRVQPDTIADNGEQFTLRIIPRPEYTTLAGRTELQVRLLDPLGDATELFVSRIPGVGASLVSATLYMRDGLDPEAGFMIETASGERADCQWHPVAYRADNTPDTVYVWAYLPGSGPPDVTGTAIEPGPAASTPGATGALKVIYGAGNSTLPAPPINIGTQLTEVQANDLRLVLRPNVNGETREFALKLNLVTGTTVDPCIDTNNPALQGGGTRLFGRTLFRGKLRAPTVVSVANDMLTAARVYIDTRADHDVAIVAINWGNFAWKAPVTGGPFTHFTNNPNCDGPGYFESLALEGIPAGWAARMLDPDTTRTEYDAAGSRVWVIKALGGNRRHFLPPLRGHIAYIALFKTSTVTADVADAILRGFDKGYAVGGLGLDRNDAIGEHGTPMLNYGEVGFVNVDNSGSFNYGAPNTSGWAGSTLVSRSFRDYYRQQVSTGQNQFGSSLIRRGWWYGLDEPYGGNPSGSRITQTGGDYPGRYKYEVARLELIHMWHRVGSIAWSDKGDHITDEDFCVPDGADFRYAAACWMGIGSQQMQHQHFWSPGYKLPGFTQANNLKIGWGKARATGEVILFSNPANNDEIVVSDGVNAARTFRFSTASPMPSDTATLRHVAVQSNPDQTAGALVTVMNTASGPSTIAIKAVHSGQRVGLHAWFLGTAANVTITKIGSAISVTGMAGGLDGTNVKAWNYLTQGANVCEDAANKAIDVDLGWFERSDGFYYSYHTPDWPHMARINRPVRDGWWLFLDPIAHDIAWDIGVLGTQCAPRYFPDHSAGNIFNATPESRERAASAAVNGNLRLIVDGHNREFLFHAVQRGIVASGAISSLRQPNDVLENRGKNVGGWAMASPSVLESSVNPATAPDHQFGASLAAPINRNIGWLMVCVARYYAICPAHASVTSAFDERQRLHSNVSQGAAGPRPSWFELMRLTLQNTMHRSGAASSFDEPGGAEYHANPSRGRPNFNTRRGSFPGGPHDGDGGAMQAVPAGFEDEWYAACRPWQQNFINTGAYAIQRRVYSWVDASTRPPASDLWMLSTANLYRYIKRVMLMSRARMNAQLFHVPETSVVGVGDPALAGTPGSRGKRGKFNTETGNANPDLAFRRSDVWWWPGDITFLQGTPFDLVPIGPTPYDYDYWLSGMYLWRLDADVEARDLLPGAIGLGGQALPDAAGTIVPQLLARWEQARVTVGGRFSDDGTSAHKVAWIIQWLRNEFGAV